MKKTFSALLIGVAALAIPALANVDALNETVKNLLADFNNAVTVAELKFDDVQVNEERAVAVKASGLYRKLGETNTLEIKVDEVSYNYGDGTAPVTKIKGSIGLDLLKIISQKDINEIAPALEDIVKDMAKNMTEGYGEALVVDAKITEMLVNKDTGDLISMTVVISGKLDLAKLPAEKPADEEEFTEGAIEFKIGVNGAAVNIMTISNPGYKGFKKDEVGLKEILEKLLALDEQTMADIKEQFEGINRMATQIVNKR